jgi:hypothetical protein
MNSDFGNQNLAGVYWAIQNLTQIWYFYLLNVKGLPQTQQKVADDTVKLTLNCKFVYTTNSILFF